MMRRFILYAGLVCAASAAETPRFETVSIAMSRSSGGAYSGKLQAKAGLVQLILKNVSLTFCVQQAYSIREYQVSGPGWTQDPRYDIVATLAPGAAPEEVWPALQTLLAERWKLAVRWEKKVLPVYALTVAPNGPKLPAASAPVSGALLFQPGSGVAPGPHGGASASGTVRLDSASMAQFCANLSRKTDHPVVDATGVAGTFAFDLRYGTESDTSASIFTALQRQLGLRLEPRKEAIDMMIIERALRTPVAP